MSGLVGEDSEMWNGGVENECPLTSPTLPSKRNTSPSPQSQTSYRRITRQIQKYLEYYQQPPPRSSSTTNKTSTFCTNRTLYKMQGPIQQT
jgi:hypothetical protein